MKNDNVQCIMLNIDSNESLSDNESIVRCLSKSVKTRARDYELTPNEAISNPESQLTEKKGLVEKLYDSFENCSVIGRMILRVWFIKHIEIETLHREKVYIGSFASEHINDFNEWYNQNSNAIIRK